MPGDGHYRLYMPESEESSKLVGCFSLLLFMVLAFGAIIGSAYLYSLLKHQLKGEPEKTINEVHETLPPQISFYQEQSNQKQ